MSDPAPAPFVHDEQLALPGLGPVAGERYRNRNTGGIVSVVRTTQHEYGWVTIRVMGAEQQITLASFQRTFVRI